MKRLALVYCCLVSAVLLLSAANPARVQGQSPDDSAEPPELRTVIERHLGRPYVWGASGLKSFDCSGFVWRVMNENRILMKRTTARKLYMCLAKVPDDQKWNFGNIVFFDNLKHCGIVAGAEQFYHAETSIGTNLSSFDPYWRSKIYGVRAVKSLPAPARNLTE